MKGVISKIEAQQMLGSPHQFRVGDTVKVYFKIVEGKTERIQVYEGLVICFKNSYGVGVERVFPFHSPRIAKIEVVREGKVRRAKLYYIREKIGKAAKIKTLINKKADAK